MDNIIVDTKNLREKLVKADDTGLIAWEIGQIANRIKSNSSYKDLKDKKYTNFGSYTKGELGKSEQTIAVYIKIYLLYPEPDKLTGLLVSHLKELIRLSDAETRQAATNEVKGNPQDSDANGNIPHKKNERYTTEEIQMIVDMLESCEKRLSIEEVVNTFKEVLRQKEEKKASRQQNGYSRDKFGPAFRDMGIKECVRIADFIEREPIDEQSFVAVFCFIFECLKFECLKKVEFELSPGDKIKFDKIKFIRSPFPDGLIYVKNNRNHSEVFIEFEYETRNYFKHKHDNSEKKCDMIIAWKDNLNLNGYPEEVLMKMPPIFLVQPFLYEGKTSLYRPYLELLKQKLKAAAEKLKNIHQK